MKSRGLPLIAHLDGDKQHRKMHRNTRLWELLQTPQGGVQERGSSIVDGDMVKSLSVYKWESCGI